jgi:ABC-type lipoprotein export system ATPase subunit
MKIRLSHTSVYLSQRKQFLFKIPELTVPFKSRLLITGPSGRGKTTLLHLMAGLLFPAEGSVFWDEKNLKEFSENELCQVRREQFGLVFQKLNLLDHLTALENVRLTLPKGKSSIETALQSLDRLNLKELAQSRAGELSLGEQQRVAIARALAVRPKILLADEPTSSLDDKNTDAVLDALFEVSQNSTLIVVSHDHRLQERFAPHESKLFSSLVTP